MTAPHAAPTTDVVVADDALLPSVCIVCGTAASDTLRRPFSLREPAYHLMLATGVFMGLFIATWMMVKVRPNITHELPAAVSFGLLFLATFGPVWLVASFTSRHRGTLRLPVCDDHRDAAGEQVRVQSKGDGKVSLQGVSPKLAEALDSPSEA
jgi:hypothetical protein